MNCGSFWIQMIINMIFMVAEDVKDPENTWAFYI